LVDENFREEFDRIGNRIKFFNKLSFLLESYIFSSFYEIFIELHGSRPPPSTRLKKLIEQNLDLQDEIDELKQNNID
jgi:hypothetical protein